MSNKKRSSLLVIIVLLVTLVGGATSFAAPSAQDNAPQRSISVTGYGFAYGAPDIARVGLGVDGVHENIKTAMDDVNTRMNAVTAALSNAGIAPKDIRTEYFSIYQDYGYGPYPGEGGETPAPKYRVSTSVNIIIRDTDTVGDMISLAVDSGANIVNYIEFNIEDRTALQVEARKLAVADAQDRAAQLAGILALAVGEPLTITESSDTYGPPMMGGGGGGGGFATDAAPAISQGQLSVSMSVTITFALVPAQ